MKGRWRLAATLERPQQPPGEEHKASPRSLRVKTPTVLQMEAVECGAAALAIILGYHGRSVSLEELRIACGVSRDGSKASNLVRAARSYGLVARGFRKEPESLRLLPLPLIVFWNFNHYLVVEGFGKDRVFLNDPASGPRTVTLQEFGASFTGVALTFERGPEFQRGGARHSLLAALRPRLRGSESALAFAILASLALVVPGLALPAFIRAFVDGYLVQRLQGWVAPLLVELAITAVLRAALTWLQQHYLLRLETKLALSTASTFFWHVLHLPVEFYTQRYPGEIGSRVAINDRVAQLLSGQLATAVLGVITIAFYALAMLRYDVPLTLLSVVIAALNVAALGGPPGQPEQRRTGPRSVLAGPLRHSAVADGRQRGGDPGGWRLADHARRHVDRYAGRLPDAHGQLPGSGQPTGATGRSAAGGGAAGSEAGRRSALHAAHP